MKGFGRLREVLFSKCQKISLEIQVQTTDFNNSFKELSSATEERKDLNREINKIIEGITRKSAICIPLTTAEITHISDFNNVLDLDGFYFGYAYNSKYESSRSL